MIYASILPFDFIDRLEYHVSPDYHLLLAHLVDYDNPYTKRYRKLKGIKLMDNGFFEGKSLSLKECIEAGLLTNSTHIVLEPFFTLKTKREYLKLLNENIEKVKKNKFKVCVVLTGNHLFETLECFNILNNHKDIDIIAIPDRLLCNKLKITRPKLLDIIEFNNFKIYKKIHLFALDNIKDLKKLNRPYVIGLDLTIIFKDALFGIKFTNNKDCKRPVDYFKIKYLTPNQIKTFKHNKKWMLKAIKAGGK